VNPSNGDEDDDASDSSPSSSSSDAPEDEDEDEEAVMTSSSSSSSSSSSEDMTRARRVVKRHLTLLVNRCVRCEIGYRRLSVLQKKYEYDFLTAR
jgi:hypothetical protein